jgi:hypothetical protein
MLTLVHTRSDGEATTVSSAQNTRKYHLMSGAPAVACLGDSQGVRVILTAYRSPGLQREILLEGHSPFSQLEFAFFNKSVERNRAGDATADRAGLAKFLSRRLTNDSEKTR